MSNVAFSPCSRTLSSSSYSRSCHSLALRRKAPINGSLNEFGFLTENFIFLSGTVSLSATMPGFGSASPESPLYRLSQAEVVELENIYKEMGEKSLSQEFCQELAVSFSASSSRAGKTPISWDQVQNWFLNKQKESPATDTSSPDALKLFVDLSDSSISKNESKNSPNSKGKGAADLSELAFEARSFKDGAWYDVAQFLNYRVVSTGEVEARVRFAGFGNDQDEWVNIKEGVRERSIPLEPSECHKVKIGDLVLCYQKREDYAVYCDAYIVDIERRIHDLTGCRCIFIVRYDHDNSEEGVQWDRLCCRPTQEEPIITLNPIEGLWG